jgi:hypothetical protein
MLLSQQETNQSWSLCTQLEQVQTSLTDLEERPYITPFARAMLTWLSSFSPCQELTLTLTTLMLGA